MADNIKVQKEKIIRIPLGISTECVCDLPISMVEKHNIEMIYYSVVTEHGVFRDRDEISPENVYEHMDNGGQKAESKTPSAREYEAFFKDLLNKYDKIIHITISSGIDEDAYKNAYLAKERLNKLGERVDIIDSLSISSGMGLVVYKACEYRDMGWKPDKIYNELIGYRHKISTSFMMHDLWYFYLNDRVNLWLVKLCKLLNVRLVMVLKEGKMKLGRIYFGNFNSVAKWYVKDRLFLKNNIVKEKIFVTHAACNSKLLAGIKYEIEENVQFKDIIINKASATVSSNCGPSTFGLLFVKNK